MKISLLQNDIVWGNPTANQEKIEEILWGLDKSDLYVLPEMFSTGFAVNPEGIAEKDESSLTWMKNMAAELKGAICGSVATEVDGRYYNRMYFVKPNGEVITYDKHHLFTYADEHLRYTRGNERVVVEFRGCRFLREDSLRLCALCGFMAYQSLGCMGYFATCSCHREPMLRGWCESYWRRSEWSI